MKGQYISLATGIALLAIFSACQEPTINRSEEGVLFLGSEESSDVVERVISPGQRRVVLNGFAGSINLVGSDSDVARFTITRTARGDSPAEAQSQLRNLDIEEVGDELTYRYNFTASQNALSRFDVTGTVPKGTPIAIQWVAGNITIDGISGKVEVQNQHGDVGYSGPSSTVRLRTRNGSAAATLTSTANTFDVALLTANGDVSAHVSPLASGNIEATTSAGAISTDSIDFVSESYSPADAGARFRGRLGQGAGQISLATQHGSVSISAYVAPAVTPAEAVEAAMPEEEGAQVLPDSLIPATEPVPSSSTPADSLN